MVETDKYKGHLMTIEEVRIWYRWKKTPIQVLAQLNACSEETIKRILKGEQNEWKYYVRAEMPNQYRCVIVNSTEGRFYPSIRAAEKAEGIEHPKLQKRFHNSKIRKTVINGMEFHLYVIRD